MSSNFSSPQPGPPPSLLGSLPADVTNYFTGTAARTGLSTRETCFVIIIIYLLYRVFFRLAPPPADDRLKFVPDHETAEAAVLRQQLHGTWELMSYKVSMRGPFGFAFYPLGDKATGYLIYTPDGHMSVQIQKPGLPAFRTQNPHGGSLWESSKARGAYMAYGGEYEVGRLTPTSAEAKASVKTNKTLVVEHGIKHSLYPNWINLGQVRRCTIEDAGRTLILRPHDMVMPSFLVSLLV